MHRSFFPPAALPARSEAKFSTSSVDCGRVSRSWKATFLNPNGVRNHSPGLPAPAGYPGSGEGRAGLPRRDWVIWEPVKTQANGNESNETIPLGLGDLVGQDPRGVAARQPWAMERTPLGFGIRRMACKKTIPGQPSTPSPCHLDIRSSSHRGAGLPARRKGAGPTGRPYDRPVTGLGLPEEARRGWQGRPKIRRRGHSPSAATRWHFRPEAKMFVAYVRHETP